MEEVSDAEQAFKDADEAVQGADDTAASGADDAGGGESDDGGGGESCANSFVGSTQVLMANGTTKAIAQVKVGDKIANAQPDSSTVQQHVVTAVHVTYDDRDFDDLTVSTSSGSETITVTAAHLIWDITTQEWTPAGDLRIGDQLSTPGGGSAEVAASRHYTASVTTYNLTIDDVHTYYVDSGSAPVLVHNCPSNEDEAPGGGGDEPDNPYEGTQAGTGEKPGEVNGIGTGPGPTKSGKLLKDAGDLQGVFDRTFKEIPGARPPATGSFAGVPSAEPSVPTHIGPGSFDPLIPLVLAGAAIYEKIKLLWKARRAL
jgi:hypothetical protein